MRARAAGRPNQTSASRISHALRRLEEALHRRAGFGHSTSTSVTTVSEGLRTRTEEGPWRLDADLSEALGGTGSAPTPGALARAALGSCLAMGYVMRAARHGVELTAITVTVETDSEIAGMLLCDADAPAGFRDVRCHVEVESPADENQVRRILDEADQLSPVLDVFDRVNPVHRTVSIKASEGLT